MQNNISIQNCLAIMQKEIEKVKKELQALPKGDLTVQIRGGLPKFIRVIYDRGNNRKRTLINKDMTLVYKLAHKAFLVRKLKRLETDISLCEKIASKWELLDDQAVYFALPEYRNYLDPAAVINTSFLPGLFHPCPVSDGSVAPREAVLNIGCMDPDEWGCMPYCANGKFDERKIHRTTNGLMCRSKGEAALIELCNKLGYRYHYDETVIVGGRLRSPDLIIVRNDGFLIYVEHRGWKSEEYERQNLEKDRLYFAAGIRQGRNYLITFEADDGGIDIELAEMMLRGIMR